MVDEGYVRVWAWPSIPDPNQDIWDEAAATEREYEGRIMEHPYEVDFSRWPYMSGNCRGCGQPRLMHVD